MADGNDCLSRTSYRRGSVLRTCGNNSDANAKSQSDDVAEDKKAQRSVVVADFDTGGRELKKRCEVLRL